VAGPDVAGDNGEPRGRVHGDPVGLYGVRNATAVPQLVLDPQAQDLQGCRHPGAHGHLGTDARPAPSRP
jgi:hypothetical protein